VADILNALLRGGMAVGVLMVLVAVAGTLVMFGVMLFGREWGPFAAIAVIMWLVFSGAIYAK
jgi:hypothetical protein